MSETVQTIERKIVLLTELSEPKVRRTVLHGFTIPLDITYRSMISSTTSLYIGIDDAIEKMHPSDIRISGINIEKGDAVTAYLSDKMNGLRIDRLTSAHLFFHGEWTAPQTFTKNDYSYDPQTDDYHLTNNIENAFTASIYTAGAHRELPNTGFDLADDECVIYTNRSGFKPDNRKDIYK